MRLPIFLLSLLVSTASANPPEPTDSEAVDESGGDTGAQPDDEGDVPPIPHVPTPAERLEEAVLNYQTNRHGLAMQQLAMLSIDQDIEQSVRQDARVYLGEILYIQGDTEGAKPLFEQVLTEDPTYQIDRFRHPPDVCGHFEYVRTYIVPQVSPVMIVRPMPPAGYAPFAAYQFKYTTSRRWPMMVGQVGFSAASLTLFGMLLADRTYSEDDEDKLQRLQTLRVAQISVTAGFYGMWLWSGLDARRHWRVNMAVQPADGGVSFMGGATWTR